MHTQAVEDYLKTIFEIQRERGKVATTMLAERLGVAPASATGMIKRLAEMHLVVYTRYQGVTLTEAGRKIALEVIRHHRLVELYLAEALGVPWDQVHAEAEKWEHILSEEIEARMDEALGFPTLDPHGAPIPALDGSMLRPAQDRLRDLGLGQRAIIAEVSDHDAAALRRLGESGLYPDTAVVITGKSAEAIEVAAGGERHSIPCAIADFIFVRVVEEGAREREKP
ncbi:MAG: metal-dependent transcriptional regulator [Caldilineales bacterium]|nr:metal-dependent transcriptional regulator [Caldilineales bacterium]